MKVTLILADFAEAVNGKLYVMGGGWSITDPQPNPMGLALKIEVPWNQANQQHHLSLKLTDQDGQVVSVDSPQGTQAVEFSADFEVGRPPGLKPGTPIDFAMAVNIVRPPLAPNSRYTWVLSIDGTSSEDWTVAFSTRAGGRENPGDPRS